MAAKWSAFVQQPRIFIGNVKARLQKSAWRCTTGECKGWHVLFQFLGFKASFDLVWLHSNLMQLATCWFTLRFFPLLYQALLATWGLRETGQMSLWRNQMPPNHYRVPNLCAPPNAWGWNLLCSWSFLPSHWAPNPLALLRQLRVRPRGGVKHDYLFFTEIFQAKHWSSVAFLVRILENWWMQHLDVQALFQSSVRVYGRKSLAETWQPSSKGYILHRGMLHRKNFSIMTDWGVRIVQHRSEFQMWKGFHGKYPPLRGKNWLKKNPVSQGPRIRSSVEWHGLWWSSIRIIRGTKRRHRARISGRLCCQLGWRGVEKGWHISNTYPYLEISSIRIYCGTGRTRRQRTLIFTTVTITSSSL